MMKRLINKAMTVVSGRKFWAHFVLGKMVQAAAVGVAFDSFEPVAVSVVLAFMLPFVSE